MVITDVTQTIYDETIINKYGLIFQTMLQIYSPLICLGETLKNCLISVY